MTIKQKVRAFAALERAGLAVPPAPSEFIAVHIPGAAKLQRPSIVMLKKVDRYHFTLKSPYFIVSTASANGLLVCFAGNWVVLPIGPS